MTEAVWLTELDVVETVDLLDAMDAVETALRAQARGASRSMEKTHVAWGDGHTLHAIGAVDEQAKLVATKTWAHTEGGATPLVVLWDAHDGALRAVVEAFALGQLRTGAMTGVATRWLAPDTVPIAALIGTGKQALAQLAAMSAARPIEMVAVHSPNPEHRRAFVDDVRSGSWPFMVSEAATVDAATHDAHIVTTATRSRVPFLASGQVQRGTLVNAIGAITPERAELAPDLVARAELVVSDSPEAAMRLAAELGGTPATPLHEIIEAGAPRDPGDVTIFKAMGIGLADLAIARLALDRSIADGRGANIARPQRARPRLHRP